MFKFSRQLHSLFLVPALLLFLMLVNFAVPDNPPVAVDDSYQVHGNTQIGDFLANDSDPDSDPIAFGGYGSSPQHGHLNDGPAGGTPFYQPNNAYVGTDSFTYRVCQGNGLCSGFATVTLTVSNQAPTPASDSYTVHGQTHLTSFLANDSDPDHDPFSFNGYVTLPQHGHLIDGETLSTPFYVPNNGFVGSDGFSYRICDSLGLCGVASVSLTVVNQAPTPETDSFTAHGQIQLTNFLANDSDPDGDPISFNGYISFPQHGQLIDGPTLTTPFYQPNSGYVGPDSFSYRICDSLGLCGVAVDIITVVNQSPAPASDYYDIRGQTQLASFLSNDSDPDGDPFSFSGYTSSPQHGHLVDAETLSTPYYDPDSGFAGTDTFTYRICDSLGSCGETTVRLFVVGDCENCGATSCNTNIGGPVNVTSGNMYLQQSDYQLPSIGYGLSVARTYNSDSRVVGLFGRGWSSQYDESILSYDASLARFNQRDGRAVYFGKISGTFSELVGDLHAQLSQGSGFSLALKDGSVEQFNSSGKLLSLTDRQGNTTSLTYDANGHVSSVSDPFGRVLTVTTNANGLATSITDSLGTIATYTYGGSNELLSVTYADNSAFNFTYDGNLRLTTVTDALGNVVESHAYDGQGRALTSEKQNGVDHYSLTYVSNTETDVTDGLGRLTKYTFDKSNGRNLVTRVEGLCGCGGGSRSQIETWSYDNQLNVLAKTDALNHVISYTYDPNGNRLTETDPSGTVTYTYNQFGEVLTRTDQLNFVTTNSYDAQGNLLSTTDARDKTTSFTYDSRGLLLSVADARDKTTGFSYDSNGNLIKRTDALSHDTQFAYDARGRLTSTTNALGFTTSFAYDGVGRLTQVTQADGTTMGYEYDLAGRRTAMTDAKGNRSTFAYDGAYRLTTQTDALNQSTSYGYDAMSNLISSTDALGRTTNYDHDDFNRLVKTTYPSATAGATRLFETIEYDAGGNVTKRIDTAGRATQYQFDALNRLTITIDAANQTTNFEYDALSRMTALVDAIGQRYRFNYNAVGMVTHLRRGTDVMSFTYDAVGNRKTRTDYNSATADYTYDALNRLKTITYPDTTTVNYTYDKLSRIQTATNENGTVNFDYNKMNRMIRATDVFGQGVEYNYDANGNRTKLSLNLAIVQTYKYDAVDRVTKILDTANAAFTFDYDPTSKLIQQKAPNNVKTSYQYDGLDRLTRITATRGTATVADLQYQFNDANNIAQVIDTAEVHSYNYDLVDRLTAATHSGVPSESYSYDGVGNRTASQLSSTYGYQRFNRLVSTTSAAFVYDANGNPASKTDSIGTIQFVWDFENRLKQVMLSNGNTVSYKYDALGRRIERTANLVSPLPVFSTTRFVYDGGEVIRDLDGNGATVADYNNGQGTDNKLRQTTATAALYFVKDNLGSTRALTNSLGAVAATLNYDSFGNSSGSSLTRYTYTGREFDSDAGLYYNRARFYDPQVGRFISEDPIGLSGGVNQFAYVGNNSLNRRDPSGLYNVDVHYYLTYFIASRFPCLTLDDVRKIAEADQHTDEDPETSPGPGWNEGQRQINSDFHAFNPGNNGNLNNLRNIAFGRGSGHGDLGRYLHYLQDTFSHQGFGSSFIGQAGSNGTDFPLFGGLVVDNTNHDVGKAAEMAGATWFAIRDWIKAKKCNCGDQGDTGVHDWWPKVIRFLETDNSRLETKRQILGVPLR